MKTRAPLIALSILISTGLLAAQAPESSPQAAPRPASGIRNARPSAIALVRIGSFAPGAAIFKDVYGGGLVYGGEFRLHAKGALYLSLGGEYFKKTGKLTVTQDPTTMTILPVDMMAVYYVLPGSVMPYVGAGGSACKYTEENIIGKVSKWGLGFAACGGVTARWGSIAFDARLKYSTVKVKPLEESVDLGGLTLSAGVGYAF